MQIGVLDRLLDHADVASTEGLTVISRGSGTLMTANWIRYVAYRNRHGKMFDGPGDARPSANDHQIVLEGVGMARPPFISIAMSSMFGIDLPCVSLRCELRRTSGVALTATSKVL